MITAFTSIIGESGVNIAEMANKSRGDVAYTMFDLDSPAADDIAEKLRAVDGVFRVRVVK